MSERPEVSRESVQRIDHEFKENACLPERSVDGEHQILLTCLRRVGKK